MTLSNSLNSTKQSNSIVQCDIKITEKSIKDIIFLLVKACQEKQVTLSNTQIKQAIKKGALWLTRNKHTQRIRRIKKALKPHDELHFYYNESVLNSQVPPATLIADYTDYSIWYKPYGMLSQGSKWSDHCTISRFAQQSLPNERPVFIVHRLDRAATGLIIVAHSKTAARALSLMFEQHNLDKIYHIIVHGNHSARSQPEEINTAIDGKNAGSTFRCLAYNSNADRSLIEVKIDSGRKHQIRIHAASIGLPVVGDRLHGIEKEKPTEEDLQLCAVQLCFTCPLTGQAIDIKLPSELTPEIT